MSETTEALALSCLLGVGNRVTACATEKEARQLFAEMKRVAEDVNARLAAASTAH